MKNVAKQKNTVLILIGFIGLFLIHSCNLASKNHSKGNQIENNLKARNKDSNQLCLPIQTIVVQYTVWGCACPNWIESKYAQNNDTLKDYLKLHFYIEPSKKQLKVPKNFDAFTQKLLLTGQFYKYEALPKDAVNSEEILPKSRIFRYTSLKIINN